MTEINYIAKRRYYKEYNKYCQDLECSQQQYVLKENLEKKGINIKSDLLKFDVLSMHKTENIIDICRLSVSLEIKINNLMNFTSQYLNALIDCNKEKHGIAIREFFEHLKDNKENEHLLGDIEFAEQFCITEFEKIKGLTKEIKDMGLADKLIIYEKIDFFDQYMNEYDSIFAWISDIKTKTKYTKEHTKYINKETPSIMN
ncbi:hypothetical protein BDAP_002097 [Binucleata daphniae]